MRHHRRLGRQRSLSSDPGHADRRHRARICYKLHYYVERRFKIDDAVGAVAVHGYGGFIGVVVAGFMLWGQPSSPYEGFAHINPLGNFAGAVLMFALGFIPVYIVSKILNGMGFCACRRRLNSKALTLHSTTPSRHPSAKWHCREGDDQVKIREERTMSTNGMTSWAVDLKDVGAIYPFQGTEVLLVIVGLVFWIAWHVIQTRQENAEINEDMAADRSGDETRRAIDRYY